MEAFPRNLRFKETHSLSARNNHLLVTSSPRLVGSFLVRVIRLTTVYAPGPYSIGATSPQDNERSSSKGIHEEAHCEAPRSTPERWTGTHFTAVNNGSSGHAQGAVDQDMSRNRHRHDQSSRKRRKTTQDGAERGRSISNRAGPVNRQSLPPVGHDDRSSRRSEQDKTTTDGSFGGDLPDVRRERPLAQTAPQGEGQDFRSTEEAPVEPLHSLTILPSPPVSQPLSDSRAQEVRNELRLLPGQYGETRLIEAAKQLGVISQAASADTNRGSIPGALTPSPSSRQGLGVTQPGDGNSGRPCTSHQGDKAPTEPDVSHTMELNSPPTEPITPSWPFSPPASQLQAPLRTPDDNKSQPPQGQWTTINVQHRGLTPHDGQPHPDIAGQHHLFNELWHQSPTPGDQLVTDRGFEEPSQSMGYAGSDLGVLLLAAEFADPAAQPGSWTRGESSGFEASQFFSWDFLEEPRTDIAGIL